MQRCLLHGLPTERANESFAGYGVVAHRVSVCQESLSGEILKEKGLAADAKEVGVEEPR